MYLNAYILQEIYQSWLVIWFGAFICFMTASSWIVTSNCICHSALWCLANGSTDISPNPGPHSLLSQVKELNPTDKTVCMPVNSRALRNAAEFGVWPKDEIFLDNALLASQFKTGIFGRGRETHTLEGNFN